MSTPRSERYADVAPCQRCSKDVALEHDPPCEHGLVACPECQHVAVCVDCRLVAEAEMHASGEYDAAKDPFFDTAIPVAGYRHVAAGGYYWDGSWHAVPRMEKKP